jgi:hypothetical protein
MTEGAFHDEHGLGHENEPDRQRPALVTGVVAVLVFSVVAPAAAQGIVESERNAFLDLSRIPW